MSKVRGKDTSPELRVRRVAHRLGLRFRLHSNHLPGKPDLAFPKYRVALFVHGCFWHRHPNCAKASLPKTREAFWKAKFDRNVQRDAKVFKQLTDLGWRVVVLWECETKATDKIENALRESFSLQAKI